MALAIDWSSLKAGWLLAFGLILGYMHDTLIKKDKIFKKNSYKILEI